jgi:hypothetical protein
MSLSDRETLSKIYQFMAAFADEAEGLTEATLAKLDEEIRDQLENTFGAVTIFDSIRWGVIDVLEYHLGLPADDLVSLREDYEVIIRKKDETDEPVEPQ